MTRADLARGFLLALLAVAAFAFLPAVRVTSDGVQIVPAETYP